MALEPALQFVHVAVQSIPRRGYRPIRIDAERAVAHYQQNQEGAEDAVPLLSEWKRLPIRDVSSVVQKQSHEDMHIEAPSEPLLPHQLLRLLFIKLPAFNLQYQELAVSPQYIIQFIILSNILEQ